MNLLCSINTPPMNTVFPLPPPRLSSSRCCLDIFDRPCVATVQELRGVRRHGIARSESRLESMKTARAPALLHQYSPNEHRLPSPASSSLLFSMLSRHLRPLDHGWMKEEEREREMVSIDQSHVAISFCQLRQERPVSLLASFNVSAIALGRNSSQPRSPCLALTEPCTWPCLW
jgi:hypothetical protein